MDVKAVTTNENVLKFLQADRPMLIGEDWVNAESGERIDVVNPATGEVISHVAAGGKADVEKAVKVARETFEKKVWRDMKPNMRARILWKLGDLIEENADELAELEMLDNGKPLQQARMGDMNLSAETFRYYAGWCTKIEGRAPSQLSLPGDYHSYVIREPIGVVGLIIPWNFPLLMAAWKAAPALAAGCSCILKPAEQTPLTALRLGELALEAGVPPGVLNIVPGYGETAGAALAAHDGVDKISFTGSTEVGKLIVQAAIGNLKKVTLELGGKSPTIVLSDANMEQAVPGAAGAIFMNAGQVCVAGSRLYVEKSAFDDVVEGVSKVAEGMKLGPGWEKETQMGPLVSDEQFERVSSMVEHGVEQGAEVVTGGARLGEQGYFYKPTVLVNTKPDMDVVQQEIFGPVVTAMPIEDISEVEPVANQTNYGLAASVWTRDISKAHKLARDIKAGTVWINTHGGPDIALPGGGYKQSGWGRERGWEGLEIYTELKSVVAAL